VKRSWAKLSDLRLRWAASRYREKQRRNDVWTARNAEELDQTEKGVRRFRGPFGPN
jgi:hypothetical protein